MSVAMRFAVQRRRQNSESRKSDAEPPAAAISFFITVFGAERSSSPSESYCCANRGEGGRGAKAKGKRQKAKGRRFITLREFIPSEARGHCCLSLAAGHFGIDGGRWGGPGTKG